MKILKISEKKKRKCTTYTETTIKLNGVIYTGAIHRLCYILEQLDDCHYGFDSGLCNLDKDIEQFLIKSKLAEKSCRGGLFPSEKFNCEKITKTLRSL